MNPTSKTARPKMPAANPFAPRTYGRVERVTDRVYIFRNIANSAFIVGDRGVAVVDTQVNRPLAEHLLDSIRLVTEKPILYAVNTHYHWDHTNGNAVFKEAGATLVASKLTREFMEVREDRQKAFLSGRGFELGENPVRPDEVFEGERILNLGSVALRLFFAGRAETDDATAVEVLGENVVLAGDTVMTGSFPIFGQPVWDEGLDGEGHWQNTIRNLLKLKPVWILPGHGPVADEDAVNGLLKIEDYFVEEVGRRVQQGMSLEALLLDLEPRLPEWIRSQPVVWGTPRYAILRAYRMMTRRPDDSIPGWQKFKPSVIPTEVREPVLPQNADAALIRKLASEAAERGAPALRLDLLRKGTELFGKDADLWTAYAEALIEESRSQESVLEKGDFFDLARACFRRAQELDPAHAGALLGEGRYRVMMAYRGGDDPQPGMAFLRQALEAARDTQTRAEAEFYIGIGHRRLGKEEEAVIQFRKALTLNPGFRPAFTALQ